MCLAEMKHKERLAEIHMQSGLKRPAAGANDFEPPSKLQAVQRVHTAAKDKLELLLRKGLLRKQEPTAAEVWATFKAVPGTLVDDGQQDVIELELLRAQEYKLNPGALAENLVARLCNAK